MDDLDKLIAEPHAVTVGKWEALGRGAVQGATLGYGDELAGSAKAIGSSPAEWLYAKLHGEAPTRSFSDIYRQGRDETRANNVAAEAAHPNYYLGGNIIGGAAPATLATIATGGGAALPVALGEGALSGAGFSDAQNLGGLARDSGAGLGLGALGYGAGAVLRNGFSGLASRAGAKISAAALRAETQGAELAGEETLSARSLAGRTAQDSYKQLEHLVETGKIRSLTPDEAHQAALLSEELGEKARQKITGSIADKEAAAQAYSEALSSEPNRAQAYAEALKKPQFGADAASFAKSYAEPLVAMGLASAAGLGPAGEAAAGVMFGRTRAGKALMTRFNRPGNQIALWDMVQGTANGATSPDMPWAPIRRALLGSAVVPAAASAAGNIDERAAQNDALEALLRSRGVPVIGIPTPRRAQSSSADDDLDKLMSEGPK